VRWARATSGHVAAPLPSNVMNFAPLHVLTLSPRIGPYHIGAAAAGDSMRLTWFKQRGRTRVKQRAAA
jgi:hypothetical protein